jgi:hypothetical protein
MVLQEVVFYLKQESLYQNRLQLVVPLILVVILVVVLDLVDQHLLLDLAAVLAAVLVIFPVQMLEDHHTKVALVAVAAEI